MRGRVVSIDSGKHTGTVILGPVEAWFSLMQTAHPVSIGDEVEAVLGKDSVAKPYARIVAPLDEVWSELRANGLLTDVSKEAFPDLVMRAFDDVEPPAGLDSADILVVLFAHYGESEDGFVRGLRDKVLVFCDSNLVPDLVRSATERFAQHLGLEIDVPNDLDFNGAFDALRFALGSSKDRAFMLPMGHNETAIVVREDLVRGRLRLFTEAQTKPMEG